MNTDHPAEQRRRQFEHNPFQRHIREASGEVDDASRLVQFFYLLARDHLPTGKVSGAVEASLSADKIDCVNGEWSDRQASRLADWSPTRADSHCRLIDFVERLVHMHLPAGDLEQIVASLPGADDTEALFSNGWLARWAQYNVSLLKDGCPTETQQASDG